MEFSKQKSFFRIAILVIGIIFFIIGIFVLLLKKNIIIYSVSFILSFLLLYIYIDEINYEKESKIKINPNTVPPKTIIKYSKSSLFINLSGYLLMFALGGYLIYLSGFNSKKFADPFLAILGLIFIIGYLIKFVKEIIIFFDKGKEIVLSNEGISYNSKMMFWDSIRKEEIIVRQESSGSKYRSTYDVNYLKFYHNSKLTEINLEDYDFYDFRIKELLEIYRNRSQT